MKKTIIALLAVVVIALIFIWYNEQKKNQSDVPILSGQENAEQADAREFNVKINESRGIATLNITPVQVIEDSRCPEDVTCIQKGTVRVRAMVTSPNGETEEIFELDKTNSIVGRQITLKEVQPEQMSGIQIDPGQYSFLFEINTEETTGLFTEPNAIYVSDQKPGNVVSLNVAVLENGGYVVIHESNSEMAPGPIIGNTEYLDAGEHSDVKITLSRDVTDGEQIFAMIHVDNGDKEFNASDDPAVASSLSGPIMIKFNIDEDVQVPVDLKL
ncbi:MAG: hypothetical protein A3G52_02000 [Candidatus Taylorbacteria bacterium RIFCSPLOWO2_12_FULL_43_20]|uniref:DUF7282 domain-containing protein n=1 Tax=Candidatus Taylorbacteria bacterium RIFCSPLOWO2_12_FULL_43_20 TaxID=1802332 RepID=A0A1G2P3Y9_9BACT|nr:MAG: hypothetical protein A2825_02785 [Candidatus Taylorbacteria bacterium RIFCSPHIGHO2_01_FULL_43_120]OHA23025.1 MAG: hypothetical protein A3B98_01970 [Candidatus Taylorbacteria bacterium RIFCSPHIGHO2_02_FULL_43_55]OHA30141.1 MAG: hypothetical protein A3E92_01005 [Candidatus Taylorbacteria bacterium RIFCSPHIGHO2_12_FULL_42_34]OHA31793.1 MAG: hypothetical protein A3B09_02510 [Candidatus Taylorbacteria bacterium RIFCSPLOWO2_01_FULL_43_83]OHA39612.1 MAG: hypothetical protein A3H58_02445 [Candi